MPNFRELTKYIKWQMKRNSQKTEYRTRIIDLINSSSMISILIAWKIVKTLLQTKQSKGTYPTGNDYACDNRNKSDVSQPSLSFERHQIRKDGSEEGRGGANGLVEGNRQVAERDVAADDGGAKHEAQRGDLHELNPRSYSLHRHHLHPGNGDVAEQRASRHVAHREKDRVFKSVIAEQVLVEQQNPNVGGVPRRHQPDREQPPRRLHCRHWRKIGLELSSNDAAIAVRPADLSPDAAVVRAADLRFGLVHNRFSRESPKLSAEIREGKSLGTIIRAMPSLFRGGIEKVKSVEKDLGFGPRNLKGARWKRRPELREDFDGSVRRTKEPEVASLASPTMLRECMRFLLLPNVKDLIVSGLGFEIWDSGEGVKVKLEEQANSK
nr:hypothetical protein B296_00027044 [Ipomoea batatas]